MKIFPKSVYLNRDKKLFYKIEGKKVEKHNFNSKIKLRKDSGIGLLSENKIIVAGGSDSSGLLTSVVILLDLQSSKAVNLPSLPIQTKEGSLYEYSDWIYYVGGTSDLSEMTQSTPLLRYNKVEEFWEMFRPLNSEDAVPVFLEHPVTEISASKPKSLRKDFEITSLVNPGTFMIGSKIYFVLGKRISEKGKLKINNCVFSLDLKQLAFRYEPFKVPLNIVKPTCTYNGERVFIMGGYDFRNTPSKKVYSLRLGEELDIQELPSLPVTKKDNFPILTANSSVLCFIFPVALFYHRAEWLSLDLNKVSVSKKKKIVYENVPVYKESFDSRSSFVISYKNRGNRHSSVSTWESKHLLESVSRSKRNTNRCKSLLEHPR